MKVSNPYYRKKDKAIVIECKKDGKSVHLKTLPHPEKLMNLAFPEAYQKYEDLMKEENGQSVEDLGASLPVALNFLIED